MKNNPDLQLDALLRAAREQPTDTSRAEFGFETRLMARLREERRGSVNVWAWKLAPFFAALAIAAGLWCRTTARVDVDSHALAEAVQSADERTLMAYMTGDGR